MKHNRTLGAVTLLLAGSISVWEYTNSLPDKAGSSDNTATVSSVINSTATNDAQSCEREPDCAIPAPVTVAAKIPARTENIKTAAGAKLSNILNNLGIDGDQTAKIHSACTAAAADRLLKSKQEIRINYYAKTEGEPDRIESVEVPVNDESFVRVSRNEDGTYKAQTHRRTLIKSIEYVTGKVQNNFYHIAHKSGVPGTVIHEAIKALSHVLNFQSGIKPGDPFCIVYETTKDSDGRTVRTGNLKHVRLGEQKIYCFAADGKNTRYYNHKGESVIRSLLRTPIDAARMQITSRFGMRFHPIKGVVRPHNGIDFAAQPGTRVLAAGDGSVEKIGYEPSGYGRFIVLRHSGGYSTVYAHLSGCMKGLRIGQRVRQGEVIGYVGATGLATAPHLHHEVLLNKRPIDPQKIQMLPVGGLQGAQLKEFKKLQYTIERKTQEQSTLKS